MIRGGFVESAHDCSEGGLAVALAECCFNPAGLLGAEIVAEGSSIQAQSDRKLESCATLFGESQSRIVISVAQKSSAAVQEKLESANVPFTLLGTVGGEELQITVRDECFRWPIAEIHDLWFNAIARSVATVIDSSYGDRAPSLQQTSRRVGHRARYPHD